VRGRLRRLALLGGLTLAGAAAGYGYWLASQDDERPPAASAPVIPSAPAAPQSAPRESGESARESVDHRPDEAPPVPPDPPRLEIPAIDVEAHAVPLGKTADNRLEVPHNWSVVGWWRGGTEPGGRGPAVVVGHVDTKTGPAVFYRLRELRAGDEIRFVRADGSRARFAVSRTESHSKDDFPTQAVYGPTSEPELRLITCDGSFDWSRGHYRRNLIVFAKAL
jgi:sortase (surface protein transpeptidase)